MLPENIEVVREIYRGWAVGDFSVGQEYFADDIVFVSDFGVDRATVRGRQAMSDLWRDQLRNWREWRTGDIEELRDLGDCVLVINSLHARGKQSGAEVEMPNAAVVFRFADGKIVWLLATDAVEKAERAVEVLD